MLNVLQLSNVDRQQQIIILKKDGYLLPKTLRNFLNCLTLTKTYDGAYIIDAGRANVENSFDNLLIAFAKYVYERKNTTREELVGFYEKAKQIKEATVAERAILEKDIEEILR